MKARRRFSRREFLWLLGLGTASAVGYARLIEPGWLAVSQAVLKLPHRRIPHPIRVLQLSDLHASRVVSLEFIARAVRLGLEQKPDLVLLTGDFITHRFDQFAEFADVLRPLAQHCPSFACLGNHDGGRWAARHHGYGDTSAVRGLLELAGIELLHNTGKEIKIRDADLRLTGLGDPWAGDFSPANALPKTDSADSQPSLVLSHNPDTKEELRGYHWDVMFCGHTHGGQMQVPLIGAPFAPVRDKRFVKGLHNWEGRWLHITKGVGNLLGVRVNCRPEVSVVTLT